MHPRTLAIAVVLFSVAFATTAAADQPDAAVPEVDATTPAPDPPADPAAAPLDPYAASGEPAPPEPAVYLEDDADDGPFVERMLHGFRLGYMYVANYDVDIDGAGPGESLEDELDMRSPHHILLGYEVQRRMVGHSWLNVLLIGNILISGMEQSKFYPSANVLIGFEFEQSFQLGIGPNLTPHRDKAAHIVFAAGWTPRVGSFHVPVHVFYVPDVDRQHRSGITFGVNW
jgi:hypothetical protein